MQVVIIMWRVLILLLGFSVNGIAEETLVGKVFSVQDGDTLTLLVDDQKIKVRLSDIDAPELKQPYGLVSKQWLVGLVADKTVRVVVKNTDYWRRKVGRVYVEDIDVNRELVKQGAAWVYRQYSKDSSLYWLENQARLGRVGLWGLPVADRCQPWKWRKKSC